MYFKVIIIYYVNDQVWISYVNRYHIYNNKWDADLSNLRYHVVNHHNSICHHLNWPFHHLLRVLINYFWVQWCWIQYVLYILDDASNVYILVSIMHYVLVVIVVNCVRIIMFQIFVIEMLNSQYIFYEFFIIWRIIL